MIKAFIKKTIRHYGYDVVPYPMDDWYLLRAATLEIFNGLQVDCVIDVGANHGQFGWFLRNIGYRGRIVSFEPVSTAFESLSRRATGDPNWYIHRLALGVATAELEIHVSSKEQFSSFLHINKYGSEQFATEAEVTRTEQVPVVRLDSMMDQIVAGMDNPRVYLKLDTQGFDLQALEGASGCLDQILGLQSEVAVQTIYEGMPDYITSFMRFNSLGFTISALVPVTRDEKLRVIEYDCLMVRSEREHRDQVHPQLP